MEEKLLPNLYIISRNLEHLDHDVFFSSMFTVSTLNVRLGRYSL